jgi:hypothetical protein
MDQTKSMSMARGNHNANIAKVSEAKRRNAKNHPSRTKEHRNGKIAKVQVENRYYTQKEYVKLTNEPKLALKNMLGNKPGECSDKKKTAMASQVTMEEDVNLKDDAIVTNRNHPELSRKS